MSRITKQDTNGVKPLLSIGELGYDNYPAGNDAGRVYVGTGTTNIALAKKSEVTAVDTKADTHIGRTDNPHSVTKVQVGLGNVDNTSDTSKPVSTATQTALDLKADKADTYTKAEVDGAFGRLSSPLLDLPLQNNLSMKAGVGSTTFTRASTATYIDRYGVLNTADIDEPRFEKEGYLNEGSSTNLLTYSSDFSNVKWLKFNATLVHNKTAPDSTLTASEVTVLGNNDRIVQAYTQSTNGAYTFSIWLKGTANETVQIALTTSGGTYYEVPKTVVLNGEWQREEVTFTTTLPHTQIIPVVRNKLTTNYATVFQIWGAQLEALPFASSYIPTTSSAVTRSADVLSVTANNNIPQLGEGTFYMEFSDVDLIGSYAMLFELQEDSNNRFIIYDRENRKNNTYFTITGAYKGVSTSLNVYYDRETSNSLCISYKNGLVNAYLNGVLVVSSTYTGVLFTALPTTFTVGATPVNQNYYIKSKFTNLKIYNNALTAQEIALLSKGN